MPSRTRIVKSNPSQHDQADGIGGTVGILSQSLARAHGCQQVAGANEKLGAAVEQLSCESCIEQQLGRAGTAEGDRSARRKHEQPRRDGRGVVEVEVETKIPKMKIAAQLQEVG